MCAAGPYSQYRWLKQPTPRIHRDGTHCNSLSKPPFISSITWISQPGVADRTRCILSIQNPGKDMEQTVIHLTIVFFSYYFFTRLKY